MKKLFLIILFYTNLVSGQIKINWPYQTLSEFELRPDSTYDNWQDYNKAVLNLQKKAFSKGLLEFSVDSLSKIDSLQFKPALSLGKSYKWNTIRLEHKGVEIPKNISGKWNDKLISTSDLIQRFDKIIYFLQNNGHPFANINLSQIKVKNQQLSGILDINPGLKIQWDTLNIIGSPNLPDYYFENYLNIIPGKTYSEETFIDISRKLKELPFIKLESKPTISFNKKTAIVQLNLKQKSANFINGVIGILPNSSTPLTGDESQLVITGDLKLNLGNSFGYGEKVKINWRRLQAESQQLNTQEDIPFILGSFIGLTHSLDLLKQDTSFINYKNRIGIKYDISAKQSFTGFWENETTNNLSNKTVSNSNLSSINGAKNAYGFRLFIDGLDYKFNPRKGFLINLEGKAGIKKISEFKTDNKILIPISEANNITSSLLVPETSMIYEGSLLIEGYIPLWKVVSLKLANNSGFKSNDYLLDNDLYRLGGFSLLRGFDQQSIFATNYSVFTLEFRLLFEENSFFNIFTDQSFLQKSTITDATINSSSAYGAGLNFQTKPGIFSINYALGKFDDTQINFSSAKIHFGFINLF